MAKGDRLGIDYHGLRFLKFARQKKAFGAVATIGRQGLHLAPWKVREVLGLTATIDFGAYCERLLTEHFAASAVDSYDNSDYESATHVQDMNAVIAPGRKYDTIIDAGCLEHVYNVTQALKNISALANPGAQILHVLPANGFCGHGFWQFSPELFFSLYSEANGYCETEVFLADLANERSWYQVKKPQGGKRADVVTSLELYVLVRTCLAKPFSHDHVQQSDYAFAWNRTSPAAVDAAAIEVGKRDVEKPKSRLMTDLSWAARLTYRNVLSLFRRTSLNAINPYLTVIDIRDRAGPP